MGRVALLALAAVQGLFRVSSAAPGPAAPGGDAATGKVPRLHAVTYADTFDPRLIYAMSTAQRHGFQPIVLGFGQKVTWGQGLGPKMNAVRDYVHGRTEPNDLVMVFDAYDVIFQASDAELAQRYLEIERREGSKVIFNAEARCTSPRRAEYPEINSTWRFLNSGMLMGRAWAVRRLFLHPVPDTVVDYAGKPQNLNNWHTDFYLDHRDIAMLDSRCELFQVVWGVHNVFLSNRLHPEYTQETPGFGGLFPSKDRVVNKVTGTTPLVLHFAGMGHWPDAAHVDRMGTCCIYEVFRELSHPSLALLMEERFGDPWKAACDWYGIGEVTNWLRIYGDTLSWLRYNGQKYVLFGVAVLLLAAALAWQRRRLWHCCRFRAQSAAHGGKDSPHMA